MKKNLLATSALVAAGALASHGAFAEAKPIELQVGGYMQQWFGFATFDGAPGQDDVSDVDQQADAEIHFTGSSTMDNGLTFGVNVQLEAETFGDQIDEAYLFVRGSFGEILLGSENGAGYAMHYGFGNGAYGASLNTGDLENWFPVDSAYELSGTYQGFRNRDNDSNKVRWVSPRISGFQIGADFSPEGDQDSDRFPTEVNNVGTPENIWSVAVNYDNTFGDFRLRGSAGYQGIGDANNAQAENDGQVYGFGLRVGFGGFEVGGSYTHEDDVAQRISGGPGGAAVFVENRDVVGGSVTYASGPLGVKLAGAYGWQKYTNNPGNAITTDTEQLSFELGTQYILGPGVAARGSVYYAEQDDVNGVAGDDRSGVAVVGGISLSF